MPIKTALRVIALVIAVIFCTRLYAQSKSFPGFYITLPGDTVKGVFSNYKQWNHNPTRVDFVDSASSRPWVLTPRNCLKFSIENHDEYVAYSGPRIANSIDDEQVIRNKVENADYQYTNIVTFLRLISKSSESELFIFSDNKRLNFFYKLPGDSISELRFKKYYDQNRIYEVPDYRQQLINLFSPEIVKSNLGIALNKLAYNEKEITDFFDKLNPGKKLKLKTRHPTAGWLLLAGVSINTLKVKGNKSIDKVRNNYGSSFSPLISIRYIFPGDRNFNRYFLFSQLKMFSYKNTGESTSSAFKNTTTFKSDFVVSIEINVGANVINRENLQLQLSGGGGMMLLPDNKEINQHFVLPSNLPYSTLQSNLSKFGYTYNISTGAVLQKRILISATYNFLTPMGNYANFTPMLGGIQLGVGYKIN